MTLNQSLRRRALLLLARFLAKGLWAVDAALGVGVHPYVLKLLQSPTGEMRDVLAYIWAKILALEPICRKDLVRDGHVPYFVTHLSEHQPSAASIFSLRSPRSTSLVSLTTAAAAVPPTPTAAPSPLPSAAQPFGAAASFSLPSASSPTSALRSGGAGGRALASLGATPGTASSASEAQKCISAYVLTVICLGWVRKLPPDDPQTNESTTDQ